MNRTVFQIASNVIILWAMGLITYGTVILLAGDWSSINNAVASIHIANTGILATVTGYVQKRLSDIYNYEINPRSTE